MSNLSSRTVDASPGPSTSTLIFAIAAPFLTIAVLAIPLFLDAVGISIGR